MSTFAGFCRYVVRPLLGLSASFSKTLATCLELKNDKNDPIWYYLIVPVCCFPVAWVVLLEKVASSPRYLTSQWLSMCFWGLKYFEMIAMVTIGRDIPGPLWVFGCAAAEPLPKLQQGLAETERCFGMLWTGSRVWRGTRANTGVARIRNPVEVVQYSSVPFPVNSQTYLIWRSIAGRLFGGSYINSLPLLRDVHWNQYHPVSICGVPEGAGLAKWFSVRNGAGGVYVSPKKSCFTPFAPSSRGCSWFALVGNPQRNLTVWSKGMVRECVVPA